jgi:hypothetical protein
MFGSFVQPVDIGRSFTSCSSYRSSPLLAPTLGVTGADMIKRCGHIKDKHPYGERSFRGSADSLWPDAVKKLRNQCNAFLGSTASLGSDYRTNGENWLAELILPSATFFVRRGGNVGDWCVFVSGLSFRNYVNLSLR